MRVVVVVTLLFVAALSAACKRDAACREMCLRIGIDPASEECTMMCNTDCNELEQKFGISVARCQAMQRGEFK